MDITADALKVVRIASWEQYPWLRHGFSTRFGGVSTVYGAPAEAGDLNLGFTQDDSPEAVSLNRRRVAEAVANASGWPMISARQIHGDHIKVISPGEAGLTDANGRTTLEADGLMTALPHLLLAIQAADCVPVLVADIRLRVVAAFHAGWRGTVAAIVQRGIARMQSDFGSNPAQLIAAVGPSIGACCYTVGEEVHQAFLNAFPYGSDLFTRGGDKLYLDLAEANRLQLRHAGLAEESITVLGECSGCTFLDGRRKYFSHRMEQGFTGRAMGLIGSSEAATSKLTDAIC